MWTAPLVAALKNGSCAIRGCEPCQVGNGAALSGLSGVPQGCLFGAEAVVNACKGLFEGEVYGSFRHSEFLFCAYAENFCVPLALFIFRKGSKYVRLSRFIQKVASG